MAETLDLLSLLSRARSSCHTVGMAPTESRSAARNCPRAWARWRALLRRTPGQAFALYHDDAVEFAGRFSGSGRPARSIYLPGDNLPGTCASLRQSVDGYLGEFDSVWAPMMPAAAGLQLPTWMVSIVCDPEFLGLVLYTSGTTGAAQAIPKKLAQMARRGGHAGKAIRRSLGAADIRRNGIASTYLRIALSMSCGRSPPAARFMRRTSPFSKN